MLRRTDLNPAALFAGGAARGEDAAAQLRAGTIEHVVFLVLQLLLREELRRRADGGAESVVAEASIVSLKLSVERRPCFFLEEEEEEEERRKTGQLLARPSVSLLSLDLMEKENAKDDSVVGERER